MTETLPVLVNGISKAFGDVRAVIDVSLEVRRGEIVGLLGPNGAGKTLVCPQPRAGPDCIA